jgi:xanthine/CO dehydrogenase XdhC/CoxF family maturation factor
MLISEDGQLTGAISGKCLEGNALRKARLVILQLKALLITCTIYPHINLVVGSVSSL